MIWDVWNNLPLEGEYTAASKLVITMGIISIAIGLLNLTLKVVIFFYLRTYVKETPMVLRLVKEWAQTGRDAHQDAREVFDKVKKDTDTESSTKLERVVTAKTNEIKEVLKELPQEVMTKIREGGGDSAHGNDLRTVK